MTVNAEVISLKIFSTPLGSRLYAVFQTPHKQVALWTRADEEILSQLRLGSIVQLKADRQGHFHYAFP
jgi:hypothetical protein